ncbi:MAG: saccharopine dehydrogenase family protein [Candidatus Lokiarchaeota archaeon]|nr:saccharopine dehydrogenase family protein [Candidatus Lokiarchaeota archaeon]
MGKSHPGRALVIGAGSVGSVVVQKCAKNPRVFSEIMLASRTLSKCERIKKRAAREVEIAQVDANSATEVIALIKRFNPDIVINVALPYQDLAIMEACIQTRVHYLDTANYESPDVAHFEYKQQWALHDRFQQQGVMAILGCGFDPGASSAYCMHVGKHYLDQIKTIDILDCNAGDHHRSFATNFNPEINIREVTQVVRHWNEGRWVETPSIISPGSTHMPYNFPEAGYREVYLLYHEELESLVKHVPGLTRARFWMTFSDNYLTHLRVLNDVGMTRIDPVTFEGHPVIPLHFLKALLPDPQSLADNYQGKTVIGCHVTGMKNGKEKAFFIYNVCDHEQAFQEIKANAVAYTAGVPAACGAALVLEGRWKGSGVFNIEQLDPDPFLDLMQASGLPWQLVESTRLS